MPYRSLFEEIPEILKRVVLRTFDIRGRARRTDGVVYYLSAAIVASLAGVLVTWSPISFDIARSTTGIVTLLFQLPLVSWLVRRLHDYGLGGFWALPFVAWMLALPFAQLTGIDVSDLRASIAFRAVEIALGIAFLCAVFWRPTEGSNHFGPDPRLDAADENFEPAQ